MFAILRLLLLLTSVTTGATLTERRGGSEADVLVGVDTDHERRNVHETLADADVAVLDEDTGVVD